MMTKNTARIGPSKVLTLMTSYFLQVAFTWHKVTPVSLDSWSFEGLDAQQAELAPAPHHGGHQMKAIGCSRFLGAVRQRPVQGLRHACCAERRDIGNGQFLIQLNR